LSLLSRLLDIEGRMGRERRIRWGPRLIDLDLLCFGDRILRETSITLPHPRMGERAFILVPLLEIAPGFVFPDGSRADDRLRWLDYRIEGNSIWQQSDDRGQKSDES
jgi:2-amino-4-hydroxy-6-hydroxymethyldihydropteridine diphosphokinase